MSEGRAFLYHHQKTLVDPLRGLFRYGILAYGPGMIRMIGALSCGKRGRNCGTSSVIGDNAQISVAKPFQACALAKITVSKHRAASDLPRDWINAAPGRVDLEVRPAAERHPVPGLISSHLPPPRCVSLSCFLSPSIINDRIYYIQPVRVSRI